MATAIAELRDFIAACRDARDARKALAVKLVYQDYLYEEIQTILDVSLGSITGWKQGRCIITQVASYAFERSQGVHLSNKIPSRGKIGGAYAKRNNCEL